MIHLRTRQETLRTIEDILRVIRNGGPDITLPSLVFGLRHTPPNNIILLVRSLTNIVQINDETQHLRIAPCHAHHGLPHLAMLAWRQLLVTDTRDQIHFGTAPHQ